MGANNDFHWGNDKLVKKNNQRWIGYAAQGREFPTKSEGGRGVRMSRVPENFSNIIPWGALIHKKIILLGVLIYKKLYC